MQVYAIVNEAALAQFAEEGSISDDCFITLLTATRAEDLASQILSAIESKPELVAIVNRV